MKTVFKVSTTLLIIFISCSFSVVQNKISVKEYKITNDYCDGWDDGYCEGWKDVKGQQAVCPIIPICPVAKIDCSTGYKCGYNRGFKAGMKAANKE